MGQCTSKDAREKNINEKEVKPPKENNIVHQNLNQNHPNAKQNANQKSKGKEKFNSTTSLEKRIFINTKKDQQQDDAELGTSLVGKLIQHSMVVTMPEQEKARDSLLQKLNRDSKVPEDLFNTNLKLDDTYRSSLNRQYKTEAVIKK